MAEFLGFAAVLGLAFLAVGIIDIRRGLKQRRKPTARVTDISHVRKLPPFCLTCPDHEACATGAPCNIVRTIAATSSPAAGSNPVRTLRATPATTRSKAGSRDVPRRGEAW